MLTAKEKRIVYKAAELVETRKNTYSCLAIWNAGLKNWRLPMVYSDFYNLRNYYIGITQDDLKHRILLLLLFAEVGEV